MAEILSGAIRDDPLEFEPIPDWTEEDFLNSSRPHEWILEHGGGDDYKTLRYRDMRNSRRISRSITSRPNSTNIAR